LGRAGFDRGDLRIDEVADPAVGADFPQTPGDLPDHPCALAHRREMLLQRDAVEGCDRRSLRFVDGLPDRRQRLIQPRFGGRLPLRGKAFLDPGHRVEHHAGVGVAVALGVFAKEPAAARGLQEGFADRGIILLARQSRAGGDWRQGKCFFSHAKLFAQIIARFVITINTISGESQLN